MRKIVLVFLLFSTCTITAVNASNEMNYQRNITADSTNDNSNLVRFKLYPTQNMWTFIELDTQTGLMWQVQYSTKGSSYRFSTPLNHVELLGYGNEATNGRFELYPTQNNWNFILLDQINGRTWQVQWSQEAYERGVWQIY